MRKMASWTQQCLTLGCYISFKAIVISSSGGNDTLSNLLKERDEVGPIIKHEDKRLYCEAEGQIKSQN